MHLQHSRQGDKITINKTVMSTKIKITGFDKKHIYVIGHIIRTFYIKISKILYFITIQNVQLDDQLLKQASRWRRENGGRTVTPYIQRGIGRQFF